MTTSQGTRYGIPEWLRSLRHADNWCGQCGERTYATQWAGTTDLLCWPCCEARQAAEHERQASHG